MSKITSNKNKNPKHSSRVILLDYIFDLSPPLNDVQMSRINHHLDTAFPVNTPRDNSRLLIDFLIALHPDINLNKTKLLEIIKKCDIMHTNQRGHDLLMSLIVYSSNSPTRLDYDCWDYLIKNSNLNHISKFGLNALMLALLNINHHNTSFIEKDHLDYMIRHSDLSLVDGSSSTALIYATQFDNDNLSDKSWKYLIDNSDPDQFNNLFLNPLLYVLSWRNQFKHLDTLINKTNIFHPPSPGSYPSALYLAFICKIKLSTDLWDILISKSTGYVGCAINYASWCVSNGNSLPINLELKIARLDQDLVYFNGKYSLAPESLKKDEAYPTVIDAFLDRINIHLSASPAASTLIPKI